MRPNGFDPRQVRPEQTARMPGLVLKAGLTIRQVLKKQYYIVPHGQSAPADEIPGKEPVFEGSEIDESKLDLVVLAEGIYIKPSVLSVNGQSPGAQIGLVEIARVDWMEFKNRAERTLMGEPGVQNFIEG